MSHGVRCRPTMFRKQVSCSVDGLDPPSWPRRRNRSSELEERPGHGPDPRFLCPTGSLARGGECPVYDRSRMRSATRGRIPRRRWAPRGVAVRGGPAEPPCREGGPHRGGFDAESLGPEADARRPQARRVYAFGARDGPDLRAGAQRRRATRPPVSSRWCRSGEGLRPPARSLLQPRSRTGSHLFGRWRVP
jgi:hypothetical protein